MPQRCSYCKNEGHNITKCQNSHAKELHKKIEESAAFTYLFPCIGDSLIRSRLERLKLHELKVLMNNWILSSEDPTPKKRKELINFLTESYWREKSEEEDIYFEKYNNKYEEHSYESLNNLNNLIVEIILISPKPENLNEILTNIENLCKDMESKLDEDEYNELIELRRKYYRFTIKPYQIIDMKKSDMEEKEVTIDCCICLNDEIKQDNQVEIKECKHSFCGPCMISYLDKQQINTDLEEITCPLCRGKIKSFNIKNEEICQTISSRFCKFRKETKKIYYGENEDSMINYLLSWLPF
jgi:hypothetical protein